MAHTHAGNAGDFLKHTILAEVATEVAKLFNVVRYIDPYCGDGLFRRPNVFRPPPAHPKLAAFRAAQPALDEWYFGSPVVAARSLAGCTASVLVSDRDPGAVLSTETALTSAAFWAREIPGVMPPRAAEVRAEVAEFNPCRLDLVSPPAANIVLLDATYRDGYSDILRETIRSCRNSGAAVLLLAWGISSWGLPAIFEQEAGTHWTASFADGCNIYEMVMAAYSEKKLNNIAIAGASGW